MTMQNRLHELLSYDPATGVFTWRIARGNRAVGSVAGAPTVYGDIHIRIDGHYYKAHRLAWLYMTGVWPSQQIDHKDNNPSNNIWSNLRLATHAQNQRNKRRQLNNTSGFKGVIFRKQRGRFQARIQFKENGKRKVKYLGHYGSAAEAHDAYAMAARAMWGEFARAE